METVTIDGNCQNFPLNNQRVFHKLFRLKNLIASGVAALLIIFEQTLSACSSLNVE
jgi:hypothetical protein